MKFYSVIATVCISAAAVACEGEVPAAPVEAPPNLAGSGGDVETPFDGGAPAMAAYRVVEEPIAEKMMRGRTPLEAHRVDAGRPRPPKPEPDAGSDAGMDAGPVDGGEPTVDAGPPREGELRSLTLTLTGMENDLHHFAQFRVVEAETRDFATMFVIHEGLTAATYEWTLPNVMFVDRAYTLDFFIDHDETTGPGFFDAPPVDHAWTVSIPAGDGDVAIQFPFNTDFFDIEDAAPISVDTLILRSTGLGPYLGELFDVRVIDQTNGRLVGRQVREIPGDGFELTVGESLHVGTPYHIDIAVDADHNGRYDYVDAEGRGDPSWRIVIPAGMSSWTHVVEPYDHYVMMPVLDAEGPTTDVEF